jgi:nucleoside-diphosphate-sugar epimerase
MAAAATKVLLLGGHGKIALHLTPLLLAKSWAVISVIRNPEHESEILALSGKHPGKLSVLVDSLDDVTSESHAAAVLEKVDPDIIVWSAGAGGKGGPSRTKAIDELAAKYYVSAAAARDHVKKFLLVSYIASRRGRPSWWSDDDQAAAENVNTKILPAYFAAKVEADEHLAAVAKKRNAKDPGFQAIDLRPGTLTDEPSSGKITIGKTSARGDVSRETVARVAAALLEREDTRGWYDLLDGEEPIEEAVARLAKERWDGIEGEDLDRIYARPT